MVVNSATKKLIKKWEGLRLKAYRCSAGVWTIGWGHTSAAGEPSVKEGMTITKREAERIFDRDIERFAARVEALIKTDVTENQFGAAVSLAFNIGVGAFSKSSVLRFINQRRFDDAADAFMLWNKVTKGGRKVVERGLTNRRADEMALFKSDNVSDDEFIRTPDAPVGKKMALSTTNLAAGATAAAGVTAAAKEVVDNTSSVLSGGNMITLVLIAVIVAGAAWIIRERWIKARDWAV
jgi:lysozyme